MKKLIIFDMDGTLVDTSLGILNSHRFAHKRMGRPQPETNLLKTIIGEPLLNAYIRQLNFSESEAREAIFYYRQYYAKIGYSECCIYPGMIETLATLKKGGYILAVATLKAERFIDPMLNILSIGKYFDIKFGMDEQDTRSKSDLIKMCMESGNVKEKETIMIGDSIHDLKGAADIGIDFIGVAYGFGFSTSDKSEGYIFCEKPNDILQVLKNKKYSFDI